METNNKYDPLNQLPDNGLPTSFRSSRFKKMENKNNNIIHTIVQELFNKHIEIYNENYPLPRVNTLFTEDSWHIEELQKIKESLNCVKNQLNDVNMLEWKLHTKRRNFAEDIKWRLRKEINPELITRPWCKFYELVSCFPLIPEEIKSNKKLKTIHLCEALGAFIASLNHWLKLNRPSVDWDWTATTLNPYYEGNSLFCMLNDDRFIMHTLNNWYFGTDNTGNLMNEMNLHGFIDHEKKNLHEIMLVTADGSIDCIDIPDEQEMYVSHLHYCETITALNLLNTNGSFLIKIFTVFEYKTICLIYLLSCCFNRIFFKKPATSKAGNSEVYVVCLKFKGSKYIKKHLKIFQKYFEKDTDLAMFRKCDIPQSFINQIVKVGEYFKFYQSKVILDNIRTFNSDNDEFYSVKNIRRAVADYYFETYKLEKLPTDSMKIVYSDKLNALNYQSLFNKSSSNSYNERRKKDEMQPVERLMNIIAAESDSFPTTDYVNYLQYPNAFEDLQFIVGAPYKEIQSSKFSELHLIKTYSAITKLKNEIGLQLQYPAEEVITNFKLENKDAKIISFHYEYVIDNANLTTQIYEMIKTFNGKETLILIGFSLLSQLNVGLIYILAHAFENVKIQMTEELGRIITLSVYIVEKDIIKYLKNIAEVSIDAKNKNKMVLSIVPITKLYEDKMYPIIVETNHLTIKYFAQYIGKMLSSDVQVDIVERLPVPFGLVRFGVAPDHPEVKNVINTFHKTAKNPRVKFLGNINVGKDVKISQLKENYHAVLLTYGAEQDRSLGIPGETLNNVISGRSFVGWYNGLPADRDLKINVDVEEAVVVGQGNVAIDIARILLTTINELKKTDITSHALEQLSKSKIRKVWLVGRRGPLQAAFTIAELREITKLKSSQIIWRPEDFLNIRDIVPNLPRPRKRLTELMINNMEQSTLNVKNDNKIFSPIFFRGPSEIIGNTCVEKIRLSINEMIGDNYLTQVAKPTNLIEELSCGVVFRSIGYKSIQIDETISFDKRTGRIKNNQGKVQDKLYAAGWVATGPTGVILSTMTNAFQVASLIFKELDTSVQKNGTTGLVNILKSKNIPIISYENWEKIDKVEQERGKLLGKPREKIIDISEMLNIISN